MTARGHSTRCRLTAALLLCLAVALAVLPLSPTAVSPGDGVADMAAMGQAGTAPPCHGDANGDCGADTSHCAACLFLTFAPTGPLADPPDQPTPVLHRTAKAHALPQPGVPPGPPRLA